MTATQSSTYQNNATIFGAHKCIDGKIFLSGGRCRTKGEPAPWLAIDFGTSVAIQRVEIVNRVDWNPQWTQNVDVRIADKLPTSGSEMFARGSLLGHFAGPDTAGQNITISGQQQL